jgi:hypothetical protein
VSNIPECRPPTPSAPSTPQATEIPVVYNIEEEDYYSELSDLSEYPSGRHWKTLPSVPQRSPSISPVDTTCSNCVEAYNIYSNSNLELETLPSLQVSSPVQVPNWSVIPGLEPTSTSPQQKPPTYPKFKKHSNSNINLTLKPRKPSQPTNYYRVSKDLAHIKKTSLKNSYYTKRYSDILRNQLVRAHSHSLLELALQFERYRQKNTHNKDPTWFLEKAATDQFIFSDELQTASNLPEADRQTAAYDFEELAQPPKIGPFVGFVDPRQEIEHFLNRKADQFKRIGK